MVGGKTVNDDVLYQANPAMFRNSPGKFLLCCALCLVIIGIPMLVVWWLKCKYTKLTITTSRVVLRKGILSKSLNEVRHEHIRNVQLYQTFVQRLFNVGRLGISTAGQSGVEITVDGIPDPAQAKSLLDERTPTTN